MTFTRTEAEALFGLLRQASQRPYGLLITDGVRDAWVQLSVAWGRANPGRADRDDITKVSTESITKFSTTERTEP